MQTWKNRYVDAGFALKKVFIDNQSQRKKLGIFFYFPFFPDRPTDPSNFEKKSVLPEIKLVCPELPKYPGLQSKNDIKQSRAEMNVNNL